MSQPDYHKAFQDGVAVEYTVQHGTRAVAERYTLHLHPIGELVVTSGHLVACDPLAMPDTSPLADPVPPGRYPVILSVAEWPSGDQRVACALLRLSEHPAVRWEMAAPQGQTLSALTPGETFGYPVDAGTGCFMDADASRALLAPVAPSAAGKDASDELLDVLDEHEVYTWSWADLTLDNTTGANVIVFSSGWGDGFYSSYWGYDAAGQRVTLVTDFGVLDPSWLAR